MTGIHSHDTGSPEIRSENGSDAEQRYLSLNISLFPYFLLILNFL